MSTHSFILEPGSWLGQGTISFSESSDQLKFYTRWKVSKSKAQLINCFQEIEIEGIGEKMENTFILSDLSPINFHIKLENHLLGSVDGKGVIDEKLIAWEFRDPGTTGFEGYEVYELQPDGSYLMRAEYASSDQMRTIVQGKIWRS